MAPGELFLDRDGQFFFEGAPCIRREITDIFFAKLERDGGGYRVRLGPETHPVRVEEAPFRVHALVENGGRLSVLLDGDLLEPLDMATLTYRGDVPWCHVRGLDARFTPSAALALGAEIRDGKIPAPGV